MLKKLLSVSGFTLASRVTGFARDALLAWTLGAGVLSDAFFVAFLFPNYFRAIFGEGTLNPAFLPRYAALRAKGEDERAATFANGVFAWQMMAQIALLVVAIIFMPQIMRFLAPGFADNPQQFAMTVDLARVTFPYLILAIVAVLLPLSRVLPPLYEFRVRSRIFRWYRQLRALEEQIGARDAATVGRELDALERRVERIAVPLAYADELYALRSHIDMVRSRLHAQRDGAAA